MQGEERRYSGTRESLAQARIIAVESHRKTDITRGASTCLQRGHDPFLRHAFPQSEIFSISRVDRFSNRKPIERSLTNDVVTELPRDNSRPTMKLSVDLLGPIRVKHCSASVKFAFGPSNLRAPRSNGASSVCFSKRSGCMIADFPELFAPASMVSGRTSIRVLSRIDLKPWRHLCPAIVMIPRVK
jgi:hypothetical protein